MNLLKDIETRTQGPLEDIATYISKFRYLLDQIHPPMTLKDQLDKTYWNLHPIYRRNINSDRFSSFSELQEIGKRVELEQSRLKSYRPPPTAEDVFYLLAAYRPPNQQVTRKFQRNSNIQAVAEKDTNIPQEKNEIAATSKKVTPSNDRKILYRH